MWTWNFWREAAERAIKTFAQTAVAIIGADMVGVMEVNWVGIGSIALVAAIASILTSIASAPVGEKGTASIL